MHIHTKKWLVGALALVPLAAALAGCGGSGSGSSDGGTLTVASPYPTVSLNPLGEVSESHE